MKVYVQAKSKKSLNERLANGEQIFGTCYSMFGGGGTYNVDELPSGTIVSIFEKRAPDGQPIAKSYGTMKNGKCL
jgi:hypothetical protein